MKKLPLYSDHVLKLLRLGWKSYVCVFCGLNAKKLASNLKHDEVILKGVLPVCLEPWSNPLDFHWPVKGLDVFIFDTGSSDDNYLNDLAYALSQYRAQKIYCVTPDYDIFQFEKD